MGFRTASRVSAKLLVLDVLVQEPRVILALPTAQRGKRREGGTAGDPQETGAGGNPGRV